MDTTPSEDQMKRAIEKISAGFAKLLEEAEDLLHGAADAADSNPGAAGHESHAELKRICGYLRNVRSELAGGARKVDAAVHAHPWQTLASGAIVGFLAGLLVRRR